MRAAAVALTRIEHEHPEWASWLTTIAPVIHELEDDEWNAHIPRNFSWSDTRKPLLAGATLFVDAERACRLLRAVSAGGDRFKTAFLRAPPGSSGNLADTALDIIEAAANGHVGCLRDIADRLRVDSDLFCAVTALLPMPLLHACSRRNGLAVPDEWACGYCPVCGAWPAFAETCGVERIRYSRCGRCGAAWQAVPLTCAYCGMKDHEALGALAIEQRKCVIEVCKGCGGYLKAFTRLMPIAQSEVFVEDLASVELDVAATSRGYSRPSAPGYALQLKVERADARPARESA